MASYYEVTFDGTSSTIPVPFPKLFLSYVKVSLDGVEVPPSGFTWLTDSLIQLTAGNPAAGVVGRVWRVTPTTPLVTFAPGVLDTDDLNTATVQALNVAEEAGDNAVASSVTASLAAVAPYALSAQNSATAAAGSAASAAASAASLDGRIYETRAVAAAVDLTSRSFVIINRFDSGSALYPEIYEKVAAAPSHSMCFQDTAGNWFEVWRRAKLSPFHAGAVGVGDETAKVQEALNLAQTRGSTFLGAGAEWSVTKLNISTGNAFFTVEGPFVYKAISASAQTCLLEVTRGNFAFSGTSAANVQYKSNYAAAIWMHNDVQLQYITARDIVAVGALVGLRIGDELHGASVTSEITVSQFRTYGCPVAVQLEGYNAYVTFDSPPSMSGDVFGGDAPWALNDLHGIVTKGFGQLVLGHGGEVTQTTSGDPLDYLIDMRPMASGGKLYWGRVTIGGAMVETGGPLIMIHNPAGLTGTAPADKPLVLFDHCSGYHSQDNAPLIEASADYDGEIRWGSNNLWKDGAVRTQPNIKCNGNLTHVWVDDTGFGNGFQPALAGVVGGILHFSRRLVNFAFGLPAVATVAGPNVLKFTTAITSGNLPRWSGNYNPATGEITVPVGGYEEITIRAGAYFPGVTGRILIRDGATEVAACPFVGGIGQVEETFTDVPAGTVYTVVLDVTSGSGGLPGASGFQHRLKVWASR